MPRTTISVARDTWCNSIPKICMNAKVTEIVIGIAVAATAAILSGRSNITTIMTEMIARRNSWRNCEMFLSTTWGWFAIVVMVMLPGIWPANSATILSTFFPDLTIFFPSYIWMVSKRALCPFTLSVNWRPQGARLRVWLALSGGC